MLDGCGRTIDYLRLSVTDLCNFRCQYCMPPEGVAKRDHRDILSVEECVEIGAAAVRSLCPHRKDHVPLLLVCGKGVSVLMQADVLGGLSPAMAEPFYRPLLLHDPPAGELI